MYKENLSNIAHQLSGLLFDVFVILTFAGWFVGLARLLNKLQMNFSTVFGTIFVAFGDMESACVIACVTAHHILLLQRNVSSCSLGKH